MQDMRALNNTRNLSSWRAWEGQSFGRSGYAWIMAAVAALATGFIIALPLLRLSLAGMEALFGLYLVVVFGLMVLAALRVTAWKRANPWTPPPRHRERLRSAR